MLSIVKMDFDSDVEILEEDIKSEVIDIDENTYEDKRDLNILNNVVHDLELIPIIYTTKLDDMFLGRTIYPTENFGILGIHPEEVTARIIKESKPTLRSIPGPPRKGRKNRKRFADLEAVLQKIYRTSDKVEIKKEVEAEISNVQTDNTVKSELIDETIVEVNNDLVGECLVDKLKPKDTCKYSELLKQCKPCRVLVPVIVGHGQVFHGGQVLKASKVHKPGIVTSSPSLSSDDDVPLITFPQDLLVERNVNNVPRVYTNNKKEVATREIKSIVETSKESEQPKIVNNSQVKVTQIIRQKIKLTNEIPLRLLRNGLLEIDDMFSNQHYFYFTDLDNNLLDYFKNMRDQSPYEPSPLFRYDYKYTVHNCCWVKKDEFIQSLYPKVLMYSNMRFIRQPHPCKPGACVCCCRNITNKMTKYTVAKVKSVYSSIQTSSLGEIRVIETKKTPKLNSNEWMASLLAKSRCDSLFDWTPHSLIKYALNYKKPPLTKPSTNRHLLTIKKTSLQNFVIVFCNFGEDSTEIYEISPDKGIETYLKTTCYNNTSQPDVKKLLRKPNVITEAICCWYKREKVISKLYTSVSLNSSAKTFLRITHTCPRICCKCCCRPVAKKEIELDDISLPQRSANYSTVQAVKPAGSSEKDGDCQITSVTNSPKLKSLLQNHRNPTIPATPVTPSLFVTDVVDGDDLSKEVNSLITSILDRFKDVRLTINGEGKVAAALNTPVNTLSTVELKVLANILSFAQSQVNVLGSKVGSGSSLSLSNIINLKVDDVQSKATIDPKTVYKEFGQDVAKNLNKTEIKIAPKLAANMNMPLRFPQPTTTPQAFSSITDSMAPKNQQFNDAFSSFLNRRIEKPHTGVPFTPVIENVFSLKETATEDDSSTTTVWYRKPAQSSEIKTTTNTSKKRNDASGPEAGNPKKIRIKSPTNSGTVVDNSPGVTTGANIPVQQSAGGLMPGFYVMPSNNFIGSPLNQPQVLTYQTCPQLQQQIQQPMLIINPLHNTGGSLIPITNTISTPNVNYQVNIPPIPIAINPASTSELVNTDNNYITVEGEVNTDNNYITVEGDPAKDSTSVATDVVVEADNDTDMVCVLEDDVNMDNGEDMEPEEDIELKYSPENNEEEEDCILGF